MARRTAGKAAGRAAQHTSVALVDALVLATVRQRRASFSAGEKNTAASSSLAAANATAAVDESKPRALLHSHPLFAGHGPLEQPRCVKFSNFYVKCAAPSGAHHPAAHWGGFGSGRQVTLVQQCSDTAIQPHQSARSPEWWVDADARAVVWGRERERRSSPAYLCRHLVKPRPASAVLSRVSARGIQGIQSRCRSRRG